MSVMNEFTASDKYILMSREKYTELKMDLERIRTAITVQNAAGIAEKQLDYLKQKYDRPAYADALQTELEKKSEQALRNQKV